MAAAFGWGGKAFTDKIGSVQVLVDLPDQVRGFEYSWQSFEVAAIFDKNKKEYFPVHVDSVKGWFPVNIVDHLTRPRLIPHSFPIPQETSRPACSHCPTGRRCSARWTCVVRRLPRS